MRPRLRGSSYTLGVRWTVIVPTKGLPEAKSRLLDATGDAVAHRRLVLAIREDTLAAAREATGVGRVVIVSDRPDETTAGDVVLVQSRPGLNTALAEAAGYAAGRWPEDGVAALVGDLPSLRPAELAAALAEAARHPRSFVVDAAGTGTTLLAATAGQALLPEFGAGSAARHARTATALAAGPGLRRDVDTGADLDDAGRLGLGARTRAAVGNATGTAARDLRPA